MDASKLKLVGETVASVVLLLATVITTVPEGWLVSRTVKVALSPASEVDPLGFETINPALSSSLLETATSSRLSPL